VHTNPSDTGDPSARKVRFDSAVDRSLVHRSAVAEVFVTDVVEREPDTFDCGVQWPRRHILYRAPDDSIDGSLVVETIRQLTIAVAHVGYRVPGDSRFLMTGMRYAVDTDRVPTSAAPPELIGRVRVDAVRRSTDGRTRSLRASVTLSADGRPVARGRGDAAIVPDVAYRRLRSSSVPSSNASNEHSALTRVSPHDVGVVSEEDVLVAERAHTPGWSIVVDPTHPIYFDHPLDHVPGSLLMDAMRQAARLHLRKPQLDFAAFEASFSRVVELRPVASVTVSGDREAVALEVRQSGEVAAVASGVGRITPAGSGG
jgi:hypothetical protein